MDTFTGLLGKLKDSHQKLGVKTPFTTSCENEIQELMRQIDVMVNAKKVEWDNQLQTVKVQLEKRNAELALLRNTLEQRNQELGQFQQKVRGAEDERGQLVDQYEQQLRHLRDEVGNLKRDHEKLQKKSNKQLSSCERERAQLEAELKSRDEENHRFRQVVEDYKSTNHEWEDYQRVYKERIQSLEKQKRSLAEKVEVLEEQAIGYQAQLNRRRQMMEDIEKTNRMQMQQLESELERAVEDAKTKEEALQELRDTVEDAAKAKREQSVETEGLNDKLQKLQHANQKLEDDVVALQRELKARSERLRVTEQEKLNQAQDISRLEHTLDIREGVIRQLEDLNSREGAAEISRLHEEVENYQNELDDRKANEKILEDELASVRQKLEDSKRESSKLSLELKRKSEELRIFKESESQHLSTENSKLQERLLTLEGTHNAELDGMREEVTNLTSELHRRDAAIAALSEKTARMERELRDVNTRTDRKGAELQVANAQLEALRLENRHLREASLNDQLADLSDLYSENAKVISTLEEDNRNLQGEVDHLRVELSRAEKRLQSSVGREAQLETRRRTVELEARLEETVKKYEEQINALKDENYKLKRDLNKASLTTPQSRSRGHTSSSSASAKSSGTRGLKTSPIETSSRHETSPTSYHTPAHTPDYRPSPSASASRRARYSSRGSATSGINDQEPGEALTYADLVVDSDIEGSAQGSRRGSVTADFVAEESKRERDLERVIDSRIAELRANTEEIIRKYT